jgi:glycosyltransferase involved in cell wall biosynthesis
MKKISCIVSCPISTYSGYGARSRDFVKALVQTHPDWDIKILPQRWGNTRQGYLEDFNETDLQSRLLVELKSKPDVWVQITVPNEFQPMGKFNIGVTAGIETTVCHHSWIEGCNRMNLVLGSSKHTVNVLKNTQYSTVNKSTGIQEGLLKVDKPLEVLFEGVNTDVYKQIKEEQVSLDLSNIKESFCFLSIGHWMQGDLTHDRKNIGYLVKAFYEIFKDKENQPALLLKVSQATSSILDRDQVLKKIDSIKKTVKGRKLPNIYLIHGDLSDAKVNELYNHPKVKSMISLTKGEGYGRPLAEFSTLGKPIISTNWSGHVDFLHKDHTFLIDGGLHKVDKSAQAKDMILPEAEWFQPNDGEVAQALKVVHKEYKMALKMAQDQKKYFLENFTYEKMKEQIINIFERYIPSFPEEVEITLPSLNLPKLQKIEE